VRQQFDYGTDGVYIGFWTALRRVRAIYWESHTVDINMHSTRAKVGSVDNIG